ncbi:hypothetical protein GGS20DRAFT_587417 [Poronia punctata]|nr:hypothetical protein GGS20DRAFT_587417 [Poronia punctata]
MTSLYDLTFPPTINILKTQQGLLEKAEALASEKGTPINELLEIRLAPDMWPLSQQVIISALHATNLVRKLAGGTPNEVPFGPASLENAKKYLSESIASLETVKPEQVNGKEAEVITAHMGSFEMDMKTVDYVQGYALPNLFFHTTTLYNILRSQGAPLGKRDFIGLHIKPAAK